MPHEHIIAMPEHIWDELRGSLTARHESAGVLLAGVSADAERTTFTVNSMRWTPEAAYLERTATKLKIGRDGWLPFLKTAADDGWQPIFVHTHPGADAAPSVADGVVDEQLDGPFRIRARSSRYVSLIVGGDVTRPSISGRVVHEDGSSDAIRSMRVVGRRIRIVPAIDLLATDARKPQDFHDRQILAFGSAGQQVLNRLRIGVVGNGGTGSAVTEQLIRLGVGQVVCVDDDHLTSTNISRVYGSGADDLDEEKVHIAQSNASRIGTGTSVFPIVGTVLERTSLEHLKNCDIIFGCTDDHTGRHNLSMLAYSYLIPVIDMGVKIDAPGGIIRSITGRVTYVAPGEPCLTCRGVVDPQIMRDEGYDPQTRRRLAREGYAVDLDEADPAVIAYTTMVASWATADMIERLFGFGDPDVRGELLIRIADRKMKGRSGSPVAGHYCGNHLNWGRADQPHFLGRKVWP